MKNVSLSVQKTIFSKHLNNPGSKSETETCFFFSLVPENSPPPQRDSYLQAECI